MDRTAKAESHGAPREIVEDFARVGQGSREPVELGDDQGVALAAAARAWCKPGSVAVGAGQAVVDVDALGAHAECGERLALRG